MPCYPAFSLLLGCAMADEGRAIRIGTKTLSTVCALACVAAVAILVAVRHVATPGDISAALTSHPKVYSLSLGHMEDLTLDSFAYLRAPLTLAAIAFGVGALGTMVWRGRRAYLAATLMMILFYQGARLALIRFDPLLSSRAMATRIVDGPPGQVIVDHHYYTFSSIAFYTGERELLLNGRWNNFEYGSNAPGVPDVFINDEKLAQLWPQQQRYYLVAKAEQMSRFNQLLGAGNLKLMMMSGGKVLLTNHPVAHERD